MGGSNVVAYILTLLTLTTHVGVGQAGQLLTFTKENYPDPRVQFQACNRQQASWVCDPGKYLTTDQADRLHQLINGLPSIGSTNAMVVSIVPKIIRQDGSPVTSTLALKEFTDYQYQTVWRHYAQNTLVIVYHIARNEVWTQTTTSSVTAMCICETTYGTRQYLATGDMATVLHIFTQKFTGVLAGTSSCSTSSDNVPYMIDANGICSWTREIIISSLSPAIGLPEGGTEIAITGQNLDLSTGNVLIGNLNCQLISRTSTKVTCRTPALQNRAFINMPLPVFLRLGGQVQYNIGRRFVYTQPALLDVQPRTTTVSGGLQLTVSGTNLNLVSTASMKTVLKDTRTSRQTLSTTECQVRDATSMLCPTPTLDIQSIRSQIQKRHVARHRAARAADDDASVPVDDVEMSVTFDVNGEILPLENGQPADITPYADPVLYPFGGEDRTHTFISVWPKSERMVDIKGTGLLPVLKDHTLNVEVGAAFCSVQEMASNLLVCHPPVKEPEKKLSTGSHPAVTVHVGNQQFDVGYLQYYDTLWKYPLTRYAIIGAAAGLLLILIVIVVCCCARRTSDKKNRKKRKKENRKH